MAAKTKRKTYAEFMAWLEGVESMQKDDWAPDPDQWRTIREMIGNLKPEVKEVQVEAPPPPQPVAQFVNPPMQHQPMQQPMPAPQMAPPQSAFEPPQQHPQIQRAPVPSGVSGMGRGDGVPVANVTRKDEILDTSNGEYQSEFL